MTVPTFARTGIMNRLYIWDCCVGIAFIGLSLIINYYANQFAANQVSVAVTDLLLDFLPIIDVRLIFAEGTYVFLLFLAIAGYRYPERIPFLLKTIALFVVIRALFLSLTHLGPPDPAAIVQLLENNFPAYFTAGYDFFFSGHTGLPFLTALIFWHDRFLRWTFLGMSIIGGSAVLLGHLHYSIDVFAAFFIAYGIFHLAQWLFYRDDHRTQLVTG